jgi:hypothetical protein
MVSGWKQVLTASGLELDELPSFSGSFRQNIGGDFFNADAELKHGSLATSSPTCDLPVGSELLHIFVCRQIEQQRMLPAVKLLWKVDQRLGSPRCSIGGPVNRHIERFLFDNICDFQRQQENAIRCPTDIDGHTVAFGVDYRFFRNDEGINHGEIVTQYVLFWWTPPGILDSASCASSRGAGLESEHEFTSIPQSTQGVLIIRYYTFFNLEPSESIIGFVG